MSHWNRIFRARPGLLSWPALLYGGAALLALGLVWYVRDAPLVTTFLRVDALAAWFAVTTLVSLLLSTHVPSTRISPLLHVALACLLLCIFFPFALWIAAGFALVALVLALPAPNLQHWRGALRAGAPGLLAAACLLLGYGALALQGAQRYDASTAGSALTSFAFWFVLLAAVAPIVGLLQPGTSLATQLFAPAWLYPLARLYSLGPWNIGWGLATLLLGGALAGWCTLAALVQPDAARRAARMRAAALSGVLIGIGLGSSAGLVAACYGLLGYGLLNAHVSTPNTATASGAWRAGMLAGALPFATPFVASWMLIGASMAGGAGLLAGVLWLATLLGGLSWALWGAPRVSHAQSLLSAALGVAAPLLVRALIAPVAAQLAGGLTPYGDINIWPWVGLAATDAAQTPVTTWPSMALALLLVVLLALVALVARLREAPSDPPTIPPAAPLADLYAHVPWLALLLGPPSPPESGSDDPR